MNAVECFVGLTAVILFALRALLKVRRSKFSLLVLGSGVGSEGSRLEA